MSDARADGTCAVCVELSLGSPVAAGYGSRVELPDIALGLLLPDVPVTDGQESVSG